MWRASCASMAIMSDRGRVGWRRVAAIVLVVILIAELILGWGQLIAALSPVAQDIVIAGIDRDELTALVIPDLRACAAWLKLNATPTFEAIATSNAVREHVRVCLQRHARLHPASSKRIQRAMLLPTAPSLDAGEITDKGSLNVRAILARRAGEVARLYDPADPEVITP